MLEFLHFPDENRPRLVVVGIYLSLVALCFTSIHTTLTPSYSAISLIGMSVLILTVISSKIWLLRQVYIGRNWARLLLPLYSFLCLLGSGASNSTILNVLYWSAYALEAVAVYFWFLPSSNKWFKNRKSVNKNSGLEPKQFDSNRTIKEHAPTTNTAWGANYRPSAIKGMAAPTTSVWGTPHPSNTKNVECFTNKTQTTLGTQKTNNLEVSRSSSRHKRWLAAGVVIIFLLFFHIVPNSLTVFPKASPSFADTFIDVGDFIKRYNDGSFIEQIAMEQTYIWRQLRAKGLIVKKTDTDAK